MTPESSINAMTRIGPLHLGHSSGSGFPSTRKAIEIARWGGVTYEWLMTGRGAKYATQEPNQKAAKALQLFERMPEYRKDETLKILGVLAEQQPPKHREGSGG